MPTSKDAPTTIATGRTAKPKKKRIRETKAELLEKLQRARNELNAYSQSSGRQQVEMEDLRSENGKLCEKTYRLQEQATTNRLSHNEQIRKLLNEVQKMKELIEERNAAIVDITLEMRNLRRCKTLRILDDFVQPEDVSRETRGAPVVNPFGMLDEEDEDDGDK